MRFILQVWRQSSSFPYFSDSVLVCPSTYFWWNHLTLQLVNLSKIRSKRKPKIILLIFPTLCPKHIIIILCVCVKKNVFLEKIGISDFSELDIRGFGSGKEARSFAGQISSKWSWPPVPVSTGSAAYVALLTGGQITSLTIVYSTVYSGADHRKHQSSASLAFVRGIHRWPVNSTHKRPVTRKMFHLMTSSWC